MKIKYEVTLVANGPNIVKELNKAMLAVQAHLSLQDGVHIVTIKSKQEIQHFDKSKLTNDGIQ